MGKSGKSNNRRFFWSKKSEPEIESQGKDFLHTGTNGSATRADDNGTPGEFVPRDGGWGWVVCMASLWANGTVFGIINTFGIIYVAMRDHYSKDDPEVSLKTAFVGSTCTGVTFLMCTISSILSDRIGIRPTAFIGAVLAAGGLIATAFIEKLELLYLTFGIMLGVGSSMVYSPSLVILGHYFKKHMGLVNGIVAFGSSLFTIGLTRILPFLLRTIDFKYCFLFLGGLQCILILLTLTWKPVFIRENHLVAATLSTESVYQHCNDCCRWTRQFLNVKIWRKKAYVIWVVSLGIALFGYFVPFFHLPKHIGDNFPGQDGSLPILCLSITSGVSRIICGKIADLPWVSRLKMQQFAFVIMGVATLCIPFSKSFGGIIAITLVMGIFDGVFVCLLGPIAFDIVGPTEASQAIGFVLGIFSIPFTLGPPVAGWMYDHFGDYTIAFHVSGIPPILGAIVMFLIPKVEQSYPAVTETQEFASISMLDVYNEVQVSNHNCSARHGKSKLAGPSGPSSDIEFIQSNEVLYLGDSAHNHHSAARDQLTDTVNETDHDHDNDDEKITPEEIPMLKHCDKDDSELINNNVVPKLNNNSESIENQNEQNDSEKDSENGDKKDSENGDNVAEERDDMKTVPHELESGSLLDEVGKYFEANRLSFDGGKTTV